MRTRAMRAAVALVWGAAVLAACGPPPGPPNWPDPMLSCQTMGGSIAYDPAASDAGVDATITALPGFQISGCTPNTSTLIYGGTITEATAVLPGFTCGTKAEGELLGSGDGRIAWDDGSATPFDVDLLATGSANSWNLVLDFTAGRWAGASATVTLIPTSSVGNCIYVPVTSAVLANITPFLVHPD